MNYWIPEVNLPESRRQIIREHALPNTVHDTIENIDPEKLQQTGETSLLTLLVLSREVDY